MRRRGSARFADYFKLQLWDSTGLVWRDVQRAHPTEAAAAATAPAGARCRIMRVTERGRAPAGEPFEASVHR